MYIRQVSVTNYRSLKNVQIGSMTPFTIFYGPNDSGKSNILAFLDLLFSLKKPEDMSGVSEVEDMQAPPPRPGVFWRGEIENFGDNFFRNERKEIDFSVLIRFSRSEINNNHSIPDSFRALLPPRQRYDHLDLKGKIVPEAGHLAKMVLLSAKFDHLTFFSRKSDETPIYLSGFSIPDEQKLSLFDTIMGPLNNCFLKVPATRYLINEVEEDRKKRVDLISNTFKNWLFQTSLDRTDEQTFKRIRDQFNSEPFKHGRISIARTGQNEIEIFVEDEANLKLPIERKGSGVQQILMILTYIAKSDSPIIVLRSLSRLKIVRFLSYS
jgi:hypothetical protein